MGLNIESGRRNVGFDVQFPWTINDVIPSVVGARRSLIRFFQFRNLFRLASSLEKCLFFHSTVAVCCGYAIARQNHGLAFTATLITT